jgi:rhodanese-related sulfurtransferase
MKYCKVNELEEALKKSTNAQIVDVREASEFASEHIEGSRPLPLSNLAPEQIKTLDQTKPVYLICLGGVRAAKAAEQIAKHGYHDLRVLEGGLKAWIAAGKQVVKGASRVWSLERQVRCAAGVFVLTGVILGLCVHPYFFGISLFVSAGLIFSAVTDTCGMGMLLARMPWNSGASCPQCKS